jgi:AbrB family looped-hinge helix DNA binding protein
MAKTESMEIIRTVDELGRIVLPKELRQAVNWSVGDKIAVSLNSEDSLILRLSEKAES